MCLSSGGGRVNAMPDWDAIHWLYENGGPVIRLRTARELLPGGGAVEAGLAQALLQEPIVTHWLLSLDPNKVTPRTYHGSADTCFENSISMLAQLGLDAGMAVLDEKTQPIRDWFSHAMQEDKDHRDVFALVLFASLLAYIGYRDEAIMAFLRKRLCTLFGFVQKADYDLYDDPSLYKGIPTAFKGKPILRPSLYPGGDYQFPLIYDLYGLAALSDGADAETAKQISAVIDYILAPEYHQKVAGGYGILYSPGGKYHAMGWDCKLPCYEGIGEDAQEKGPLLIQRALLLACFPGAAGHPWLKGVLAHLESFATGRGTYLFPRHYLKESLGYFVSGMHMSLGENRRNKNALELESTFYMLLLKKRAGLKQRQPFT